MILKEKYSLPFGNHNTPLTEHGIMQAMMTGKKLMHLIKLSVPPDIIFCSPFLRTKETLIHLAEEWHTTPIQTPIIYDDRIREQEHGLATLYNDWRIFHVFHPEQKKFYNEEGPYWYRYPQGESASDTRERVRSFTTTMIREYAEKNVIIISHHLTKLSIRANYERMSPEQFIELDEKDKPVNCGVTIYKGNPNLGKDGKLELIMYNKKLY